MQGEYRFRSNLPLAKVGSEASTLAYNSRIVQLQRCRVEMAYLRETSNNMKAWQATIKATQLSSLALQGSFGGASFVASRNADQTAAQVAAFGLLSSVLVGIASELIKIFLNTDNADNVRSQADEIAYRLNRLQLGELNSKETDEVIELCLHVENRATNLPKPDQDEWYLVDDCLRKVYYNQVTAPTTIYTIPSCRAAGYPEPET